MKKILIIFLMLITINSCFAIRAVTEKENRAYYKSIGLSDNQILKLKETDEKYYKNRKTAIEISNKLQYKDKCSTIKECENYGQKLIKKAEKDYDRELSKIMNFWQKNRYLEYKSRVY